MSVQTDHVTVFRNQWATRFVDSITIDNTTSRGVFNPATGAYDTPTTANVYTGNALIRPASRRESVYGDQLDTRNVYDIHLPYDATGIALEHVVTVVTSATDSELDGSTLVVTGVEEDSYLTHRLVTAELDVTP